jgi:hypothetical protein
MSLTRRRSSGLAGAIPSLSLVASESWPRGTPLRSESSGQSRRSRLAGRTLFSRAVWPSTGERKFDDERQSARLPTRATCIRVRSLTGARQRPPREAATCGVSLEWTPDKLPARELRPHPRGRVGVPASQFVGRNRQPLEIGVKMSRAVGAGAGSKCAHRRYLGSGSPSLYSNGLESSQSCQRG